MINLTIAARDALDFSAVLMVDEYPIPDTDRGHLDACLARDVDLSQLYINMKKPLEVLAYLTDQVEQLSGDRLTVRQADPKLFAGCQRTPEVIYAVVCVKGNTQPGTVVRTLTNDMRLVMLTPTYGGLKLHSLAR